MSTEKQIIKCPYCGEMMELLENHDDAISSMFEIYYLCRSCMARSHSQKHAEFNWFTKYDVHQLRKFLKLREKEMIRYNKSLSETKEFVYQKALALQEKLK